MAKRFRIPRVRSLKLHFPPCNVTQPRLRRLRTRRRLTLRFAPLTRVTRDVFNMTRYVTYPAGRSLRRERTSGPPPARPPCPDSDRLRLPDRASCPPARRPSRARRPGRRSTTNEIGHHPAAAPTASGQDLTPVRLDMGAPVWGHPRPRRHRWGLSYLDRSDHSFLVEGSTLA